MLLLASTSPRRKDLLDTLQYVYEIKPSSYEEDIPVQGDPSVFCLRQARGKASAVSRIYSHDWVLAADTIVALGTTILGKPHHAEAARHMLQQLSGKEHMVFTAVVLRRQEKIYETVVQTRVIFRILSAVEIDAYIRTKEPMDKAGAYAIQGRAASFIKEIHGSFTNVIGLPLAEVKEMLVQAQV